MIQAAYSNVSTGTGLQAQYYNDHSEGAYPLANPFAGTPVLTRTDPTVDFSWGEGSPGSPVDANNFSVKWTGQLKAPVSGTYTFTVTAPAKIVLRAFDLQKVDTSGGARRPVEHSSTINCPAA